MLATGFLELILGKSGAGEKRFQTEKPAPHKCMGHKSAIEWTEATWNPWHGCHKVSQGCKNCYMFRDKARYGQDPNVVVRSADKTFYAPLKWQEPRTIFTCSWSDFFIEEADAWRDEAFAIMALTPQHTYQVLTKRPDRMRAYLQTPGLIANAAIEMRKELGITFPKAEFNTEPLGYGEPGAEWFPLKNVWLGVSVEDQKTADERIPLLLQTPAAVRWLSMEPLLGPVDITNLTYQIGPNSYIGNFDAFHKVDSLNKGYPWPGLDWIVAGGESGTAARPSHPDWFRSVRDQCSTAGVPFFFKQWGEWVNPDELSGLKNVRSPKVHIWEDGVNAFKMGKKGSGRRLDGRTWDEMPEVSR